ncbi:hypothetical protein TSMEX_011552, partial [Taenia solium]
GTIVICDRAQDGLPPTRTILLAHIVCLKVAKRASALRQPTLQGTGRSCGWIYLRESSNAKNLACFLVSRGPAQVQCGIRQTAVEKTYLQLSIFNLSIPTPFLFLLLIAIYERAKQS